jgi:hypothetical protein
LSASTSFTATTLTRGWSHALTVMRPFTFFSTTSAPARTSKVRSTVCVSDAADAAVATTKVSVIMSSLRIG